MAPKMNIRVLFNEIPKGYPDPKTTFKVERSQMFDVDSVPLNGGIAVKILVLSIDPYLRYRMRGPGNSEYNAPPFELGKPIQNFGVSAVLRSEDPSVSVGDHLLGRFDFAEYAILPNVSSHEKVEKPFGDRPWSVYFGITGWPGKTAYYGYLEYIRDYAKEGDTLFVTTGAGPVGSFVIQLAKEQGLKVIASAGSAEKVKFMQECGADVAFNYKTTSTKEVLAEHGPLNFYWDHVGSESLDLALEASAPFARFLIVGLIAGYNGQNAPLKNYANILFKSLTMTGFVVFDLDAKHGAAFRAEVPTKVSAGKIKYLEYVKHGLEEAGEMIVDVQTGKNIGKAILIVAEE